MLPKDGIMLLLIKFILGLFMVALIIFATWNFSIIGLALSLLMAFILNNGLDRYERSQAQKH